MVRPSGSFPSPQVPQSILQIPAKVILYQLITEHLD